MDDSQDVKGPNFAPSVPSGVKPDAYDAPYNQWLFAGGKPAKDKLLSDLRARLAAAEHERDEALEDKWKLVKTLADRNTDLYEVRQENARLREGIGQMTAYLRKAGEGRLAKRLAALLAADAAEGGEKQP